MDKVLQHMAQSDVSSPADLCDVYCCLLGALSNRQGMPNTIGSIERLSAVFCNFDHRRTLQRYTGGWRSLFDTIQKDVQPESRMEKGNPRSYWVIFCKGAVSGAEYLARFETLDEFLRFVADFDTKSTTRPALPLLMSHEIFGYGFSLACDFLKRIGYSNYAKPDTHLIDILSGLGVSDGTPLDIFRAVSLIADEVGETPYAVDRAFWLIGSGKLYLHNIKFRTSKWEFVEEVTSRWEKRPAALQNVTCATT